MKLHIISDLHCEFSNYSPTPASFLADAIVLPGDIWKYEKGIAWARATWPDQRIIYVPGNHEFYGQNRLEILSRLRIAGRECNVDVLDNDMLIIGTTRFLGTTLFTDFNLFGVENRRDCMSEAINNFNDFRVIHEGTRHFSPMDSVVLHEESIKWLKEKVNTPFEGQTVVVSHHLPSGLSIADEYKNDKLSACFASHLDQLLDGSKINLWIHGHTHSNFDYMLNGTRVICNPRGYVYKNGEIENTDFNANLVVDVTQYGCEIITPTEVATVKVKPNLMSARMRDAAILAIDDLDVREFEGVRYIDLYALNAGIRVHVNDIVSSNSKKLNLAEHKAILPLNVSDIEWLVTEIVKRATVTNREPNRRKKTVSADMSVTSHYDPKLGPGTQITDKLIEEIRTANHNFNFADIKIKKSKQ